MPLTPATTDKFQKVGLPGSATNLSSPGYTVGNNALTVGATTNHPTDTLYTFAVDRAQTVNGVTSRIPGTYCEFEGIVTGATTIGSVVLKYGTAQNYPAGSFTRVYIPVSSNRENALIDGLNQDHNGKGNHKNLTDDNGNIWLERNQTAGAVNQVRVSNSTTGNGVAVEANGSDTNTNIHIRGKGSGVAVLKNSELFINFVASGGIVAISSGLIGTFSDMFFYVGGDRFKKTSVANKTYTASKDTYVDADPSNNGTLTYTEVANGAASPALTTNYVRIAKVVTSASAITSIIQGGLDSLGNFMLPLRVGTKTVDANGWTVYEQGGSRRYVKRFPTAFAVTQGIGANAVAGPFGEASGLPLPVGIASLAQVFCKVTGGMLSGGDVISLGINQTDMTTSNVTPNVYAHNTYNATVNIQKVIIEMELLTM